MKSYRNLYPEICDFANVHLAYLKARKNKRYRDEVLAFSANLEESLSSICRDLQEKSYVPGPYRHFTVYEPKERKIMAAPFRDRVIHHAFCNIIDPIFERGFIFDSYACRKGKGIHAASNRTITFLRAARCEWGENFYCLKADVAKYFPSIRHDILLSIIGRKIACCNTLKLIEIILDSGVEENREPARGIPIGNLTSQLWANVFLNELDHRLKEKYEIRYYARYMDDFFIFHPSKNYLKEILAKIKDFFQQELDLKLNQKTDIFPASHGINFVGYRHFFDHRTARKQTTRRIRRGLKTIIGLWRSGELRRSRLLASLISWYGYLKHADSYKIRKHGLNPQLRSCGITYEF